MKLLLVTDDLTVYREASRESTGRSFKQVIWQIAKFMLRH